MHIVQAQRDKYQLQYVMHLQDVSVLVARLPGLDSAMHYSRYMSLCLTMCVMCAVVDWTLQALLEQQIPQDISPGAPLLQLSLRSIIALCWTAAARLTGPPCQLILDQQRHFRVA
jgi:hypothetical protein